MPHGVYRATLLPSRRGDRDEQSKGQPPEPERPMSDHRDVGSVTAELSGLVLSPDSRSFATGIHLRYVSTDPYAVVMTVGLPGEEPIPWTFGRELLDDGLSGTCGAGDVSVAPCPQAPSFLLHVTLRDDVSHAVLQMGTASTKEFLRRTYELVPRGSESSFLLVEDDVSAIAS
jgi:Streptomyces sporulation and cell division protein, SsgA